MEGNKSSCKINKKIINKKNDKKTEINLPGLGPVHGPHPFITTRDITKNSLSDHNSGHTKILV